jgi:hypothetical protein
MVLETAKQRYKNWAGSELKRLHRWEAVRHRSKWMARSAASSITDLFVSLSEVATEEQVTRLIDQDRAKSATRKEKWKECSSSQSNSSSAMGDIKSTLKKLSTTFTKVQM